MSGGILGNLFKNQGVSTLTDDQISDLILTNSGESREMYRHAAMIKELTSPDTAYKTYFDLVKAKSDDVAAAINVDYKRMRAAGISHDEALKEAYAKGSAIFETEKKMLKLEYPIANSKNAVDILASAQFKTPIEITKYEKGKK